MKILLTCLYLIVQGLSVQDFTQGIRAGGLKLEYAGDATTRVVGARQPPPKASTPPTSPPKASTSSPSSP